MFIETERRHCITKRCALVPWHGVDFTYPFPSFPSRFMMRVFQGHHDHPLAGFATPLVATTPTFGLTPSGVLSAMSNNGSGALSGMVGIGGGEDKQAMPSPSMVIRGIGMNRCFNSRKRGVCFLCMFVFDPQVTYDFLPPVCDVRIHSRRCPKCDFKLRQRRPL